MVGQRTIPERLDLRQSGCPATPELEQYTAAVQPNEPTDDR
ncbi:hypothetical protein [Oculatella sp. LEGE 06141]|nr:hypothetical protein [Oculatella sp. LEGE 06141]